ncbi:hypothetical protein BRD00_00180 [Halobacteriales archaeon QS_8_69_26]|nr:MAG: hypothetical protein BRD00_00180 [Halobacteriales archaeon QS_8_69_26]
MPRNRVEELESTVAELESTVAGLTEELVEAKERIRDLEAELEPQPADGTGFATEEPEPRREETGDAAEGDAELVEPDGRAEGSEPVRDDRQCESGTPTEEEADDGEKDDIIVA